ncbi:MAG: FKBP-type peptidyl-prolyl cis-trans isomerase [Reichenbachiella sp.]
MKKESVFLALFVVFFSLLAACSDPIKDKEEEEEQAYQDSVNQGNTDAVIIEDYLESIGMTDQATEGEDGLYYVVLEEGIGAYPMINDIVSTDYIGKFTDGQIFDTSIKELALTTDSLYWVGEGKDIEELMATTGGDLATVISDLNASSGVYTLYSSTRSYNPVTYNHTAEGTGISTGFISGFRTSMHLLTPELNTNGRGASIMPSALGYGTAGSSGGSIPSNTVLIFEFIVDSVRVQ